MKKWVIGVALAGIGGFTLVYLFSNDPENTASPLSRTVMLAILKELRRELAGPLISLANLAKWVKSEYNFSRQSDIDNVIRSNCKIHLANLIQQIESIQERIFSRYNMNKNQVEFAFEEEFVNDQEIQLLANEMKQAINQAYQGVIPRLENPIPSFVTERLVLSVLKEIYLFTLTTAYNKIQELKEKGVKIDVRTKEMGEVEKEIEDLVESEKQEIFKRFGLLYLEDSPSMIIHTAGESFARNNPEFSREQGEIENEYRNNVEIIMKGTMTHEQFLKITKLN